MPRKPSVKPQTSNVGTGWSDTKAESDSPTSAPVSKRRAVACRHCHALKVKCVPVDENDKYGSCQRCAKAKRECVIDFTQARKRKAPTAAPLNTQASKLKHLESQVSELMKLTSRLQQVNSDQAQQISDQRNVIASIQNSPAASYQKSPQSYYFPPTPMGPPDAQHSPLAGQQQVPLPQQQQQQQQPFHQQQQQSAGYRTHSSHGSQSSHHSNIVPTPPYPSSIPHNMRTHKHHASPSSSQHIYAPILQDHNSPHSLSTVSSSHTAPLGVQDSAWNGTQARIDLLKHDIESLKGMQEESFTNSSNDIVTLSQRRFQLIDEESNPSNFDVISKGWLTEAQCQALLDCFVQLVLPVLPAIEMPPDPKVHQILLTEPRLFVAIMYISSTVQHAPFLDIPLDTQIKLEKLMYEVLFREVYVVGAKTLEVLRSVLIAGIWYSSAELFHNRRYHLLNVLSVSLIQDLGLTGRPYFLYNKEEQSVRKGASSDNTQTIETRTLVLTTYLVSVCIALFLRRRIPVQCTDYVKDCIGILENLDDEKASRIAIYARMSSILEKSHCEIHTPSEPIAIGDYITGKHKMLVKEVQKELDLVCFKIFQLYKDDDATFNALMSFYYSVQVHVHEPAIHRIFTENSKPILEDNSELPQFLGDSLETCSLSCIYALKHFGKLDKSTIALLPLFFLSRMIYTAGILLRLRYASLHIPTMAKFSFLTNDAVQSIYNLHTKIYECSMAYPRNHFLLKMRLVIGLFTQTYATQCTSMLDSNENGGQNQSTMNSANLHNMDIPDTVSQHGQSPYDNNAIPTISIQKDQDEGSGGGIGAGASNNNPGTPLDILSQAAEHHERRSQSPGGPQNYNDQVPSSNVPPQFQGIPQEQGVTATDGDNSQSNGANLLGYGLLNQTNNRMGFAAPSRKQSFSVSSIPNLSPRLPPDQNNIDGTDMQYWLLDDEVWSDLLVPTEGMGMKQDMNANTFNFGHTFPRI